MITKYSDLLEEPRRKSIRGAHLAGFFFGFSQMSRFIFVGLVFYISSLFIKHYNESPKDCFIAIIIIFLSAVGSASSLSHAPSIGKAKSAAVKIFDIIEEESKIDVRSTTGEKIIQRGEIELRNVDFKYPSRSTKVLSNCNMKITATKKIALVGHSGCGKSTIANLLLRMYDVVGGQLLIDGIDIRDYNVKELRRQIGIVMQEPLLFNTTIKENILYGNDKATDIRVREVAQMANAL